MDNKKFIIAVCAIIAAGAIFFVIEKVSSAGTAGRKAAAFFPALTENSVTAIAMNDRRDSVRLEKIGGMWMVVANNIGSNAGIDNGGGAGGSGNDSNDDNVGLSPVFLDGGNNKTDNDNFPANELLVKAAIEQIMTLRKTELISNNPANQMLFGVTERNGMLVEIFTQNKTPDYVFIVGGSGPDWNSNYVRISEHDEVYLIYGNIRQTLFLDIERWKKTPEPMLELGPELDLSEFGLTDIDVVNVEQ